jgi:hypothetical protein
MQRYLDGLGPVTLSAIGLMVVASLSGCERPPTPEQIAERDRIRAVVEQVRAEGWTNGHQAGWEWARQRGISDPADCGGKSRQFRAGCRVYAEEYLEDIEPHGNVDSF